MKSLLIQGVLIPALVFWPRQLGYIWCSWAQQVRTRGCRSLSLNKSKAELGSLTAQHSPALSFGTGKPQAPDKNPLSVAQKLWTYRSSESVCNSRNPGQRKSKGCVCRCSYYKSRNPFSWQKPNIKDIKPQLYDLICATQFKTFQNKADEFSPTFPPYPTTKLTFRSRKFLEKERRRSLIFVWTFAESGEFVRHWQRLQEEGLSRRDGEKGKALKRPWEDFGEGGIREQQKEQGSWTNNPHWPPSAVP